MKIQLITSQIIIMKEKLNINNISYKGKIYHRSFAFVLNLIGDRYKSLIIFHLKDGSMRSGKLQKNIKDISNRMFTYAIRGLEKDGLVRRRVYPITPPKVEYELTKNGKSLIPLIFALDKWGLNFAEEMHLFALNE